jgi:N-methylhydantoinase B
MPTRDGVDTGGHTSSLRATIANVESYELRYPILYLYRRQTPDSGGPGRFRGGAGISMMYTVHGVDEIPTKIMHTFGVEQPESPGLCGGYPSTTNRFAIARDSDVERRFAGGEVPQSLEALDGELVPYGAYAVTSMKGGDVYRAVSQGGGGYGDPIDRDPALVAQDVGRRIVTPEWAARVYGVLVNDDGTIDADATAARREEIRAERRSAAGAEARAGAVEPWDAERDGVRLLEALFYDLSGDAPVYRCRCGCELGAADVPYKEHAAQARFGVQRIGPDVNPNDVGGGRFELREFYCPGCLTLLEIEIARPGDPVLDDARLTLGGGA